MHQPDRDLEGSCSSSPGRHRWKRRGLALPWLASLLCGCAFLPPLPVPDLDHLDGGSWAIRRIESSEIGESSGLVRSRTHPGVFWTHNDSRDSARIFAISAEGALIGEFAVENAVNRDWEDIAVDDSGHLYVGDFGNNLNRRRDLVVYRIPEPDPYAGGSVRADLELAYRYADQVGFPQWGAWNFDAEALFWMDGALFIFTKHRSDQRTQLYRLPVVPESEEAVLEPLASFELGDRRCFFDSLGNVTGADLHPEGELLALLTYRTLFLFARDSDGDRPFRLLRSIEFRTRRTRQVESVAWDGDELIVGNEQRTLFRIPNPLDYPYDHYPP